MSFGKQIFGCHFNCIHELLRLADFLGNKRHVVLNYSYNCCINNLMRLADFLGNEGHVVLNYYYKLYS